MIQSKVILPQVRMSLDNDGHQVYAISFSCSQLFGFPIAWLRVYLLKVILEMGRAYTKFDICGFFLN
jgi:hypothetical protein